MAPANNVDLTAIMTALGGRQALQDLLGVGASAISNYVARGTVPTHVRSKLYGALTARLPAIFDALEQRQPPPTRPSPQPSRWPLGLAILALGLAILSFFTHFHLTEFS